MKTLPRLTSEQVEEVRDFVKKTKDVKEFKRGQAVLLLDEKKDIEFITKFSGYSRSQIFSLRDQYLKKGIVILKTIHKGEPRRLLTKKELKDIVETVKTKKPKDVGFSETFEYWSTGVLGKYIENTYGVKYKSKTSYYLVFKQAKFTFHKPGKIYQKHDQAKVDQWKKDNSEKIEKAWNEPNTIILCEDEMKLSNQTTFQKIWLPANDYPQVKINNKKESRSIYGFLNVKTGQEHAFKTSWQNMYITKEQLIKIREIYKTQHILVIWDGPGSHKGYEVKDFMKADGNMEAIYFPAYAPENNPQERVWREGRKEVSHNHFIENIDKATDDFVSLSRGLCK
jgi:transposase